MIVVLVYAALALPLVAGFIAVNAMLAAGWHDGAHGSSRSRLVPAIQPAEQGATHTAVRVAYAARLGASRAQLTENERVGCRQVATLCVFTTAGQSGRRAGK